MNLVLFAWKNLQRQPLHTGLRVFGIALTAAVMMIWGALTGGFTKTLHAAATGLELGDFQIHRPGYRTDQDVYAYLADPKALAKRLTGAGFYASPRLYAAGLAASGERSAGVLLRGLDPEQEAQVTNLHAHVASGAWLDQKAPKGAVVGRMLARQLGLGIGDELIVLGAALDGSLASEILEVRGVLRSVNGEVDNRGVFVVDASFREIFQLQRGAHEVAIRRVDGDESLEDARSRLEPLAVGEDLASWRELKPLVAGMLDLLSVTAYFTLTFTYLALGGLILNMMFMIIHDRRREYGVMKAIGMTPRELLVLIVAETGWLALCAGVLAWVIGLPIVWQLSRVGLDFSMMVDRVAFAGVNLEPVLYAVLGPRQIFAPVVFLIVMMPLFGLYPALDVARMPPLAALDGR